jgi:hypothetical protein
VFLFAFCWAKAGGGWCWLRSLHYAVVALGTPNVTFLVALDTGSDLFWVPCDCINCAPLVSPNYRVPLLLLLSSCFYSTLRYDCDY